ncbi:MAG TPA: hypothetical protein VFQ76_19560 [Longimicrobiaceae bacterium]|nr:hypothetical protein [Longimicrobiaceae bacterium]
MTASQLADAQHERANLMYWNSSETVDRIAEQLGMSRNALYASVRPAPTGAACPDCGEELVYPNRTSRLAGRALCVSSGKTHAVAGLPPVEVRSGPAGAEPRASGSGYEGRNEGYREAGRAALGGLREGLAAVEPQRAALIGGAAVMGAVAGVAAVSLLRRFR